jgi:chromosome partitioning protein
MLISFDRDDLHKIVVLNPKGGSGKTTLATNIAGYYAILGPAPILVDCDSQGFSTRWIEKRSADKPEVHGVTVFEESTTGFRTVNVETRPETETVIIDMPANIKNDDLRHVTYDANSILIPVMPSPIDIYGASRFIAELLLNAQLDRRDCQVAVVANRTRENTNSYKALMRFLTSLKIPLLTSLRDSQNYIRAAANGLSIYELPAYMVRKDLEQMDIVTNWLNGWQTRSVGNVDMATEEPVESQHSETMLIPQHLRVAN